MNASALVETIRQMEEIHRQYGHWFAEDKTKMRCATVYPILWPLG